MAEMPDSSLEEISEPSMQSIPRIETERLLLRAIHPQDADDVFALFSDLKVANAYEFEPLSQRSQAEEMIQRFTSWFQQDQAIRWGIFPRGSQRMVGSCCLDTFHPRFQSANLGYSLRSDVWGQGLASEAVAAMLNFTFEHGAMGPLNRVQAMTDRGNRRSQNLLRRLQFQEEGRLRQYGYWKGQFHDMRVFGLLKDDWLTADWRATNSNRTSEADPPGS